MSACLVNSSKFSVLLWVKVTVEFPGKSFLPIKILIGRPTILLLPMLTACLPLVGISYRSNISKIPKGVAGKKVLISKAIFPKFSGRSEERRVGKQRRMRWPPYRYIQTKKKIQTKD